MTAAAGAPAERMVDRVHGLAAHMAAPPIQRLRPALPIDMFMLSGLDTAPTVAMQRRAPAHSRPN